MELKLGLALTLIWSSYLVLTQVEGQALYRGSCPSPPIEEIFQTDQFLGRWFEVERTFALFEATLRCVSTEYYLREDGKLGIRNSGVNALGREQSVTGHAIAQDPLHPARLTVFLQGVLFPANLTVLHTDYKNFAVLWSCNELLGGILGHTENMWILARKPYLDEQLKAVIYQFLIQTGVGLKGLKMVEQNHCPQRAVKIPEEPEDDEYHHAYKPDLNHNYHQSVASVPDIPPQAHVPQITSYHGPPQGHDQGSYQQEEIQPNYQAEVQLGQRYKPGKAPYPNQGHAQVPHYHDDGPDKGQGGIIYKQEDDRNYGHRGQVGQGSGQVHFNDEYPTPREVDQPRGNTQFPQDHEEEPRTYRDRKGLRQPEADESRQSSTTKGQSDEGAKEFLESHRRNVTLDDRNTSSNASLKDKGMEYYEYIRNGDDTRIRNSTRRLRRPALEDDLKLDKDTVRFLDLDKRNKSSSLIFISTKSNKEDLNDKRNVTKRSIKIKVD